MNSSQRRSLQRQFQREYAPRLLEARLLGASAATVQQYAKRGAYSYAAATDLAALIERLRSR